MDHRFFLNSMLQFFCQYKIPGGSLQSEMSTNTLEVIMDRVRFSERSRIIRPKTGTNRLLTIPVPVTGIVTGCN
jgi:hypothetical protein